MKSMSDDFVEFFHHVGIKKGFLIVTKTPDVIIEKITNFE